MTNLNDIALSIEEHAAGRLTLREADVTSFEESCYRTVEDPYVEERNIRFANLLLDVLFRIRKGDGVRACVRI